ncbi:hypothetical protein YC2023_002818 [Brassica napus]
MSNQMASRGPSIYGVLVLVSDREKSLAVSSLGDARKSPERPPGATPRSRSHLTPLSERPPKATPRGRSRLYGETTRSEAWSNLSERPTEVAPEGRSDLSERHAESLLRIVSRLKVDSLIDHLPSLVRYLITQGLIPMPMNKSGKVKGTCRAQVSD